MEELNKNELMGVSNETSEATVDDSGLGTKVGIAIGTALTLAVIGIVRHRAKKAIAELKAKNEEEFDEEVVIDDSEKEETN